MCYKPDILFASYTFHSDNFYNSLLVGEKNIKVTEYTSSAEKKIDEIFIVV